MSPSVPLCSTHPLAPAGWACTGCERRLCADCTAAHLVPGTRLELCAHCDAVARRLTLPGSAEPFTALVQHSLLSRLGAGAVGVLGGVLLLTWGLLRAARLQGPGAVLLFALLLALAAYAGACLLLSVLHAAARAPDGNLSQLPVQLRDEVLQPALYGLPLALVLLGPSLAWDLLRGHDLESGLADPVSWLLLLLAAALTPAGLTGLAQGRGLRGLADVGRLARVAGRDHTLCVAGVALCGLFAHAMVWTAGSAFAAGGHLVALGVPLPGGLALLLVARLVGLLLHAHAFALGQELPARFQRPALPGVAPRGARSAAPPPPAPTAPRSRAPIALEEEAPVAAGALAQVQAALAAEDFEGVFQHYARLEEGQAGLLPVEAHLAVGRAAAAAHDGALAARALHRAATLRPEHPEAPRALVLLARVHAERLADPATARALFARVLSQYPGTAAAHFAAQQLER